MKEQKKQEKFFCDILTNDKIRHSKIIRHKNYRWKGIKSFPYKDTIGNWSSIVRIPLINSEDAKFEVRYFEISPGGSSSLEYHSHIHVVICLRGKGKLKIGNKSRVINYLDIAYIAPNEIHQLYNPFNEPFGFLCIVDKERDRPIEIKE